MQENKKKKKKTKKKNQKKKKKDKTAATGSPLQVIQLKNKTKERKSFMIDYLIILGLVSSSLTGGIRPANSNVLKRIPLQNVPSITPSKLNSMLSLSQKEIANVELIMLNEVMKYTENTSYCIRRSGVLKDFDDNLFVLVEFDPIGYGIYCVDSGDFTELSPFAESPYKDCNLTSNSQKYIFMCGYYDKNFSTGNFQDLQYKKNIEQTEITKLKEISKKTISLLKREIKKDNIQFMSANTMGHELTSLNSKKLKLSSSGDGAGTGNVDFNMSIVKAETEVPYSWYFKYNNNGFSNNTTGTCGYTALSMILTYHEVFRSAGYFSSSESKQFITPSRGEYGKSVPKISDAFPTAVWGTSISQSVPGDMSSAVDDFMEGKNKSYSHYVYYSLFSTIEDPIKDGFPAIYFGKFNLFRPSDYDHAVVVYGVFDNGKLLCHWGWRGNTQVIINKLGLFNEGGVYSLFNQSPHVHKAYFINSSGWERCGCGVFLTC